MLIAAAGDFPVELGVSGQWDAPQMAACDKKEESFGP